MENTGVDFMVFTEEVKNFERSGARTERSEAKEAAGPRRGRVPLSQNFSAGL